MRDAIGGSIIMVWILIFLVVITSILGFAFNYTKAFRLKNAVLDYLEDGQGFTPEVQEKIMSLRTKYGYGNKLAYADTSWMCDNGICIKYNKIYDGSNKSDPGDRAIGTKYCGSNPDCKVGYYSVTTFIYVNIPIIVDVLAEVQKNGGLNVSGDTATIKISNMATDHWGVS